MDVQVDVFLHAQAEINNSSILVLYIGSRSYMLRPRIVSPWLLRNDEQYIVAYLCSTERMQFKVLSLAETSIVPFLDGLTSINELRKIWIKIHSSDGSKEEKVSHLRAFDVSLEHLVKNHIVSWEGHLSPSLSKRNLESLIPCVDKYKENIIRLKRPLSVSVALTNKCFSECRYCYADRKSCDELSFNEWKSIYNQLSSNKIFIVDISGGDIFTHPDALRHLSEMVKRDFVFFLSTKSYISMSVAAVLAELGIGKIDVPDDLKRPLQFSIDSVNPKIAAFLVNRESYLEQIVQSIKNMIKVGCNPRIKAVMTGYNIDGSELIVKFFSDLGVKDFQFVQYGRSYYRHKDSLFLDFEQKKRMVEIYEKIKANYSNINITIQQEMSIGELHSSTWDQWHRRAVCSGGRTNMVIKPNGDVTLCEQIPHESPYIVGNALKQGILEVWNSSIIHAFNNPPIECFKESICFNCSEFNDCHNDRHGYCYRDSLFSYGTIYEAPPNCPKQTKIGLRQI